VDPLNPYLAFKLNEVDVFSIPEEKLRQISSDEQIQVLPGPKFFLYLRSSNLTPDQMMHLTSVLDLREISRAVLNEHVEIFLPEKESDTAPLLQTPFHWKISEVDPFRLAGERIRIQLQNHGFIISSAPPQENSPLVELIVREMHEPDLDLLRYKILRENFETAAERSWFEEWDQLESAGAIVPLMIYESRVAVRKSLIDVRRGSGGILDFSNAWFLPAP
jgi:hypothetical protein